MCHVGKYMLAKHYSVLCLNFRDHVALLKGPYHEKTCFSSDFEF